VLVDQKENYAFLCNRSSFYIQLISFICKKEFNSNIWNSSVVTKVWPAATHRFTKDDLLALHKPTEIEEDFVNSLPTLFTKESMPPVALLPIELQEEVIRNFISNIDFWISKLQDLIILTEIAIKIVTLDLLN
jgi:hypothetical protein